MKTKNESCHQDGIILRFRLRLYDCFGLDLVECLRKVFEDVVDVFRTNGETDCGRSDVLFGKLFLTSSLTF